LFLDLDGTVLEFALDPARVEVPGRLADVLRALPDATDGAVAFVSGRTMADLDRLLGHARFPLAAVHGLERRDARGRVSATRADAEEFARIREVLESTVTAFPGASIEHKGLTLAVHYRRCPEVEDRLLARVEAALASLETQFILMRGKMVLEIKPAGTNKGTAIAAFMQEAPFHGRTPVFIGDDVTDEDGFRAVNALGGVSVKVAAGDSSANFRLPDTESVIAWLQELVSRR
jgi:trehalose 6-phosphate phosphatase